MKKGLFALALGTFTLGMTEFIIEGILTDVAHDMNVSIPQVGHLISIYALGVCVGAFSLILMHKYRPKNILMFLTSLITIGAAIASTAPSFGSCYVPDLSKVYLMEPTSVQVPSLLSR